MKPEEKYNSFYNYLCSVLILYQNSIPVIMEKFEAINNDNIEVLNKTIQIQQAFLLKIRGFETSLDQHLKVLEISGDTLSTVILKLPKDEHSRFFNLLGELESTLQEIKFYNDKSQALLQTKLYLIDRQLSKNDSKQESTAYSQNAKEVHMLKPYLNFETKI